ncbi:hypothetical protein HDU78_009450 [Chytriomyces hyalinus]|nr:hypothetical protein HDU78_009450 [Chytriomyces hyalinus]
MLQHLKRHLQRNQQQVAGLQGITIKNVRGKEYDLVRETENKAVIFVNIASKCGFARQYDGLEALYKKYKDQGLLIIGVPSNDFKQEPTDGESCRLNYGVSFPLMEKCHVNGPDATPLYVHLRSQAPVPLVGDAIQWNFEKFLLGKNGKVIGRFAPVFDASFLAGYVEKELGISKRSPWNDFVESAKNELSIAVSIIFGIVIKFVQLFVK